MVVHGGSLWLYLEQFATHTDAHPRQWNLRELSKRREVELSKLLRLHWRQTYSRIKLPSKSGSLFYNYKQYFSIILQGVVDDNCKFLCIDVWAMGKQKCWRSFQWIFLFLLTSAKHDGSAMWEKVTKQWSDIAFCDCWWRSLSFETKHHAAFPEKWSNERKGSIQLYRLSWARRCIECAFGTLSQKFRILDKTIETKPETVDAIVKAPCILHNLIIQKEGISQEFTKDEVGASSNPGSSHTTRERNPTRYAITVRNSFMEEYFTRKHGSFP